MLGFKLDLFLDPTSKIASILNNKGVLAIFMIKSNYVRNKRDNLYNQKGKSNEENLIR